MCLSLRARQVYPHSDRLVDHLRFYAIRSDVRIVQQSGQDKLLFEQSPQKRWLILKLLDDDFLASVMTNQKYEVNSKSALRGR